MKFLQRKEGFQRNHFLGMTSRGMVKKANRVRVSDVIECSIEPIV